MEGSIKDVKKVLDGIDRVISATVGKQTRARDRGNQTELSHYTKVLGNWRLARNHAAVLLADLTGLDALDAENCG